MLGALAQLISSSLVWNTSKLFWGALKAAFLAVRPSMKTDHQISMDTERIIRSGDGQWKGPSDRLRDKRRACRSV